LDRGGRRSRDLQYWRGAEVSRSDGRNRGRGLGRGAVTRSNRARIEDMDNPYKSPSRDIFKERRLLSVWRIVALIALSLIELWALTGCYLAFGVFVGLSGPDMPLGNRLGGGALCVCIAVIGLVAITWIVTSWSHRDAPERRRFAP
jgi:hypothetical protein